MPTSLAELVLFVVLLAPGMVYVRRRERQQAAVPASALREITTIVLASVACELLVAGLLGLSRIAWSAATPDVGALVRGPAGAIRTGYAALALWGIGLLAAASVVALVGAAVNLPARIGQLCRRVRWLAWLMVPATGEITPSSVWWNTLYARYPAASVHVGCVLDDGSYIDGWLSEFDPSPVPSPDRELVLAAPIRYRPPGAGGGYQLPGQDDGLVVQAASGVVLAARTIRVLFVRPVQAAARDIVPDPTANGSRMPRSPAPDGPPASGHSSPVNLQRPRDHPRLSGRTAGSRDGGTA